jgi:hypothetical protein
MFYIFLPALAAPAALAPLAAASDVQGLDRPTGVVLGSTTSILACMDAMEYAVVSFDPAPTIFGLYLKPTGLRVLQVRATTPGPSDVWVKLRRKALQYPQASSTLMVLDRCIMVQGYLLTAIMALVSKVVAQHFK